MGNEVMRSTNFAAGRHTRPEQKVMQSYKKTFHYPNIFGTWVTESSQDTQTKPYSPLGNSKEQWKDNALCTYHTISTEGYFMNKGIHYKNG